MRKNGERGSVATEIGAAILVVVIAVIGLTMLGSALGWFGEAAQVAQDEFGPKALLKKYEWFKDASAQLDAKRANVTVLEQRMKNLVESYGKEPRKNWAREDREQYNVWVSETAGVKASYNQLAAEYNSQMVKFNYRFTNVGQLPQGAEKVLPREYKPYLTE